MMKNIFTLFIALIVATTAFGQHVPVTDITNRQAKPFVQSTKATISSTQATTGHSAHQELGEKCLQHPATQRMMDQDPLYRAGVEEAHRVTQQITREIQTGERAAPPVYTVPVVFHVIHKGEPVGTGTNISDAQIESAIDALNRDYRKTSADGGIGQGAGPDTEIQFCLAGVDPNGNPHSGITRHSGMGVSGYASNGITSSNEETVKALSNWDNRYYMNVWIVSEIDGNGADLANPNNWPGGTLGYAYLPQTNISWMSDYDGIVVVNICLGNDPSGTQGFRLWPASTSNRTLTHEAGHYLGLRHVFSDSNPSACLDGDGFTDTPNAKQTSSFNCSYPNACTNQMIENYMDYTNEQCQNRFTNEQKAYMRSVLAGVRNDLVNTSNCGATTNYDAAITAITTPTGALCETNFTPVVTLTNYGSTTLTSVQIQYAIDAQPAATYNWTGSLSANSSTSVTLNPVTAAPGAHVFSATTVSGTLNGSTNDEVPSNDETTSNFTVNSGGSAVTLTLNLDCYGDETSWEIKNENNVVVASGLGYVNNASGQQIIESLCLAEGCYDFIINDTYGDGMNGSNWAGCTIDGNYTITDDNGILVQMTAAGGDFGYSATHNFCIGGGGGTPTCETLAEYKGEGFLVNPNDLPNFDVQAIDNDQQPVSTTLANAGYTSGWMAGFYEIVAPGDTNWFIGVTSWFQNTTVAADNWFTFGPVTMLNGDGQISWKHFYGDNDYRDGYEVLVNTTGTDISDFNGATVLYSAADNAPATDGDTTWTQQSVALPSGMYANQPLYFAIHHNALDKFLLFFDDIEVQGCTAITVDMAENEQLKLNVYPNPSLSNFTFNFNMPVAKDLQFKLLNAMGQEVWNHTSSTKASGEQTIETHNLSAGVYTLMVQGKNLNVSERLILTK